MAIWFQNILVWQGEKNLESQWLASVHLCYKQFYTYTVITNLYTTIIIEGRTPGTCFNAQNCAKAS